MTIEFQPVTSYRLLVLHDGHSRKIVKSPFQFAQIPGPDYRPNCKCSVPEHREVHHEVHAALDSSGLQQVVAAAVMAHRPEQLFLVKGGMFAPRFKTEVEGVKEVAGKRFLAMEAFVTTETQKRDLEGAYKDWCNIAISVVPDLHERLAEGHDLTDPFQCDSQSSKENDNPHDSGDAHSIPRRLFSWL